MQKKYLRLRESKRLEQGHTADKWFKFKSTLPPQTPRLALLRALVVMVQCLLLLRCLPVTQGTRGPVRPLPWPPQPSWPGQLPSLPAPPGPGVSQCQCPRLKLRNVASFSPFTLGGRVPGLAASLSSASLLATSHLGAGLPGGFSAGRGRPQFPHAVFHLLQL